MKQKYTKMATSELITAFVKAGIGAGEQNRLGIIKLYNKYVKEMFDISDELYVRSEEEALLSVLHEADAWSRLNAAIACWEFDRPISEQTLEALAHGRPMEINTVASMALDAFREGRAVLRRDRLQRRNDKVR